MKLKVPAYETERVVRGAERWKLHPEGDKFLDLGGKLVPPPLAINMGLTNKCNLRCEICGSQKYLDVTGIPRRHMDYAVFQKVAETLFPFLYEVELNSQGDPLLYPRIEDVLSTIAKHGCEFKIQHNGTLLRDKILDILLGHYGTLMLSMDAVGPRFDKVRRGGVWEKAQPGLERLCRERDPARLSIGVYPTVTRRTLEDAIPIADWCAERGIELLVFHRYNPIKMSFEESPTDDEYKKVRDELREWSARNGDPLSLRFESEFLTTVEPEPRKNLYADPVRRQAVKDFGHMTFPIEGSHPGHEPNYSCASPNEYIEVGLFGQMSACCRAQDVNLGYATSVEEFAKAWFGYNYKIIRESLLRTSDGCYPLPNCEGCMKFFAPVAAGERVASDYASTVTNRGSDKLRPGELLRLDAIQKEIGHCHIATFPTGTGGGEFELFENDRPLGPSVGSHDDIREHGGGRYTIGPVDVYFSTSDSTDARRNGRSYTLRRKGTKQLVGT